MKYRNVIFHNPRCSKSRQTLQLIENAGAQIEVVKYLESPPTKEELRFVCDHLSVSPLDLIRTKDALFAELKLSVNDKHSDDQWFELMSKNPALMERPIVIYHQKAVIGRPPENVLGILT